ncbi:MAG: hypothetical protein ACR2PL_19315 [Dehalococcoidia bacterium]
MLRRMSLPLLVLLTFAGVATIAPRIARAAVVSEPGAAALPATAYSISISAGAISVPVGTSVTLTATSNQSVGSGYEIQVAEQYNVPLQQCGTGASCSATVSFNVPGSHTYLAKIVSTTDSSVQATSQPVTVTWTTPFTVQIAANATSVQVGTPVTLTATSNIDVGNSGYTLQITQYGQTIKECTSGTTCTTTVSKNAPTSEGYYARIALPDGSQVQASSSSLTVTWTSPFTITLAASAATVSEGTPVTLTATSNLDVSSGGYAIQIRRSSTVLKQCPTGTTCSTSDSANVPTTNYYNARIVSLADGAEQASSSYVSVTWTSSLTVSLAPRATSVPVGTSVTLTATSNQDVSQGGYAIQILQYGTVLKQCTGGTTCSTAVSSTTPTTGYYSARIALPDGSQQQASSDTISVTWTSAYSGSLAPQATTVPVGTSVTITATSNQDVSQGGFAIQILQSGTVIKQCTSGRTCSTAVSSNTPTSGYYSAQIALPDGSQQQAYASTISVTWTSTFTVSLAADATSVPVGTNVMLTAISNQDVAPGGFAIQILQSGTVLKQCTTGTTCSTQVSSGTPTTNYYSAQIVPVAGGSAQAGSDTVSVTWTTAFTVGISASMTNVPIGTQVSLLATSNQDVAPRGYAILILEFGTIIAQCTTGTTCSTTVSSDTVTSHTYRAQIALSDGTQVQATSRSLTVTWTVPFTVNLTADATFVSVGTAVNLAATSNQDVSPGGYEIQIVDEGGANIKQCTSGTVCSATVSSNTATSHTYTARILPANGGAIQATSQPLTVTWGSSSTPSPSPSVSPSPSPTVRPSPTPSPSPSASPLPSPSIRPSPSPSVSPSASPRISPSPSPSASPSPSSGWTVTLTADALSVPVGTSVTLTATSNRDVGPTAYDIEIIDEGNGAIIQYCVSGTICSVMVYSDLALSDRFHAQIATVDGTQIQAISPSLTITWGSSGTPSPSPTALPSATPSPAASPSPSATASPSASPSPSTAPQQLRFSSLTGNFFANPSNSGAFTATPSTPVVFSESFAAINFNPPVGTVPCSNATNVDVHTRPFTDVVPQSGGACALIVAQGNGQQAGVGGLNAFNAVFSGSVTVPTAGNVTFNFFSDDGWLLGIGPSSGVQPAYVSGSRINPPRSAPFSGYQIVGAFNTASAPARTDVVVAFPAAGTYPFELDYSECCSGELSLTLTANQQLIVPGPSPSPTPSASPSVQPSPSPTVSPSPSPNPSGNPTESPCPDADPTRYTVCLDPPNGPVVPGSTIVQRVKVTTPTLPKPKGLRRWGIRQPVTPYDPALYDVLCTASLGSCIPAATPGQVLLTGELPQPLQGTIVLATLRVTRLGFSDSVARAAAAVTGETRLDFTPVVDLMTDEQDQPVTPVVQPAAVVTVVAGDVNADGRVTALDALCALRSVATLPGTAACPVIPLQTPSPAKVSSTGTSVTAVDALCILRSVAQLSRTDVCPLIPLQ